MRLIVLFLMILNSINCQKSAQYLQNAVRDLRRLNYRQTLRRADTDLAKKEIEEEPTADKRLYKNSEGAPTLSLTKGELLALYENALANGKTLKLDAGDNTYVHAAVHEIDDHQEDSYPKKQESNNEDGYYYYYYPIKTFLDEMKSQASNSLTEYYTYKPNIPVSTTTHKPKYQYHSHHHEHNISIKKEVQEKKQNKLEPLFMAISGFVGMAVMFVVSLLIFPKFGSKPKKPYWPKTDEMDELARLALNALEGKDCRERFACELSKNARNFNMPDNRFIKLLRRMVPGTFGNQMEWLKNPGNRQLKCTLIPCKKRVPQKVSKITKKIPVRKKNA